jgi:uncharacterized protein (DUF885 family)
MKRNAVGLSLLLLCSLLGAPLRAAATDYAAERARILAEGAALAANTAGLSEPERFAAFVDLYLDYTLLEHPEMATYMGVEGDHGRWTDGSPEAVERREQTTLEALDLLRTIDRDKLDGDDRLDYDLLVEDFESTIEGQRFKSEYLQLSQMGGLHSNLTQMLTMMPAFDVDDFEARLARLRGVPKLVEDDIHWLREGLAEGVTPPKVTLRDVPDQFGALLVDDPLESPILAAFAKLPDTIPVAERERLRDEAVSIYREIVEPALTTYRDFVVDEYIPGCRESIAMSALPDGSAWYAYNVKQMTTTDLAPQAIHEIGLAEVARIRGEMDEVIETSGFEGTFEEFTRFLRTDPQFFFTEAEALLDEYRNIAKKADLEMVKLFGRLPRLPYGIVEIPEYMAKSQTTAYYNPGSLEAGRPGMYYANTWALDTRPKWEMEALTLHEAVPGHHHQIAIAQEIEDLPWFRRFGGYGAFVEGWGLYAESLGEEMGFYRDPYSKFGQLTYEMWRAVRLVVDTGMHSLGWTRQQAIDYFIANSAKTEHDIVVEIDRYIVWPGQALGYKIGELKIKELRELATEELGESFDLRAFHDAVLGNGALPLSVLEAQIRDWIEARKQPEVASPESRG